MTQDRMKSVDPNPYEAPKTGGSCPQRGVLVCPKCGGSFALTWRRYFGASQGIHQCPHCQARLRLRRSLAYFCKLNITSILLETPALAIAMFCNPSWFSGGLIGVALVLGCVGIFVLDRKYDTENALVPIE